MICHPHFDKYIIERNVDGYGTAIGTGDIVRVKENRYEFPFGDLLQDYLQHINKPFWRRKHDHKLVTRGFIQALNTLIIHKQE